MSQPRAQVARPRHTISMSQQSPLVSSSTITFFASWRGQLLICTVVLIVGGVYFLLQEPIASYRRARKEVLSKVREKELMSMTTTEDKEAVEENKDKEKRGRDKRKDPRKRKGSLLKVPTSAGISGESSPAPSSMESSPAPTQKPTLPSIPKLPQSDKSASHSVAALPLSPPTRPAHDATPKKSKAAAVKTPISYPVELPEDSLRPPYTIPLPETPGAGPSRIILPPVDNESESQDGEAGTTSESAPEPPAKNDTFRKLSDGFSIIPEEGYLPASIADLSGKKKKRKNKVPPPALPKLNGSSSVVDTAKSETDIVGPLKSPPPTPSTSRHARKASLTRPIGVNLEDLLSEREKMIDTLRAEIGAAKAEEAKAREEASRGKHTEERLSRDVERMRKANAKSESESRRREIELTSRLSQMTSNYTTVIHRLAALENMLREAGRPPPPPLSPAMPGMNGMGMPIHHAQGMTSPLPPLSPYGNGLGYGPSPRSASGPGFVPYPSPGMYPSPSPMLHPHSFTNQTPSPFRRSSTGGQNGFGDSGLAGPLTPGNPGFLGPPQHSPLPNGMGSGFPFDMNAMPLILPSGQHPISKPNGGQGAQADLRRQSIESSVLKKKGQAKTGSDSDENGLPLQEIEETDSTEYSGSEIGLGMGHMSEIDGIFTGHRSTRRLSSSSNGNQSSKSQNGLTETHGSHPSSPSPPNRTTMLLTPASASGTDLFHQMERNGSRGSLYPEMGRNGSTDDHGQSTVQRSPQNRIKVVHPDENDHSYYEGDEHGLDGQDEVENGREVDVKAGDQHEDCQANGQNHSAMIQTSEIVVPAGSRSSSRQEEAYMPMFASLAHTPAQVAEIRKMKEAAMKARGD